jgi:hypothetical protein
VPWPVAWSPRSQWAARVASSIPTAPWTDPGDFRVASIRFFNSRTPIHPAYTPDSAVCFAFFIGSSGVGPLYELPPCSDKTAFHASQPPSVATLDRLL